MDSALTQEEFSSLLELTYGGHQKQVIPLAHRNKLLELGYIVDRGYAATAVGKRLLQEGQYGST